MHRPPSIILFERFFWAAMVVGFLTPFFAWDQLTTEIGRDPSGMRSSSAFAVIFFVIAVGVAISIAFWYGIARRASNVAKWIYVVWMGISALSTLASLFDPTGFRGLALGASLLSTALTMASIICLFRADAVAWLSGKPPVDPGVFN